VEPLDIYPSANIFGDQKFLYGSFESEGVFFGIWSTVLREDFLAKVLPLEVVGPSARVVLRKKPANKIDSEISSGIKRLNLCRRSRSDHLGSSSRHVDFSLDRLTYH
jgi:hypothetical protein